MSDRRATTILFTDIEGFTELLEEVGDAEAHRVLMDHDMIVRSRVTAAGGREVKTTGDGFLVTFPAVRNAVRCATAIQHDLADRDGVPLGVRMGLHAGSVIRSRRDVHGRNVVVAARIAALARGGEVLVSRTVRTMCGDGFSFGDGRTVRLAGIAGDHVVHPLHWKDASQTAPA